MQRHAVTDEQREAKPLNERRRLLAADVAAAIPVDQQLHRPACRRQGQRAQDSFEFCTFAQN